MDNDEWELVREFVRSRSDAAFAEVVRRYVRLVYGRCARQLGDPHAAEDVTQGVFLVLADRAAGLSRDVPLGAWLYRVAGLACRNEVRMRSRRRRHEAAAAAERARTAAAAPGDDPDVAALAPMLDAAVDRLGASDRQAVLMRYFEGRSVGEVAAALGVPENTAGRRLLRAVGKLRATFAAGGVAVPATAVGPAIAAVLAATAAPAARAGAVPTGPAAKAVARAAGRSLRWAAWEPAIAAAIVLTAIVGSGIALVVGWPSPPAPVGRPAPAPQPAMPVAAVVAPPAPTTTGESPESRVPGLTQLAEWDVLLTEAGYRSIADVGRPIDSPSRVYQARLCDAAALRHGVAAAQAAGGVPLVSHQAYGLGLPQAVYDGKRYTRQLFTQYDPPTAGPWIYFSATSQRHADRFDRQPDGTVAIHLDHPDLDGGVAEREYENPWRTPSGITFDGSVIPGQTVAFVGRFRGRSGMAYYHLMAWEAYRATPTQAFVMGFPTDAGWWCRTGPEPLRLWADQARVWADWTGSGRPFGPPSLQRKLPDGELVWLFALCRPSEYPWCWWDPAGKPAAMGQGIPFNSGLPDGLWAELDVSPPLDQIGRFQPPTGDESWGEQEMPTGSNHQRIDDGPKPLHVGVPVGLWTEAGQLRYGQPVTAGGVRYEIQVDPDNPYWPKLTRRGVLDDQFHLVGVHRDGSKASPFQVNRELMWGEPGLRRDLTESVFAGDMPNQIDHFSIRIRKRAFVTFDGFATRPATVPPAHLTRAQADAELARIAAQHLQLGLDQWQKQRVGYLFSWPGKQESWNDGMRTLLHAAVALDEATVLRSLDADDPRAAGQLGALAHLAVTGEAVRSAVARRFGEPAARGLLDRPGLFEDLQGELVGVGWAGTTGSRYHVHPYTDMESNDSWMPHVTWRQGPTGDYALDVDDLFPSTDAVDRLADRCRLADDVLRLVSDLQRPPTLDDVRRRLGAAE
jgi:RNA polymerase sigma factor (sigma-70 family)